MKVKEEFIRISNKEQVRVAIDPIRSHRTDACLRISLAHKGVTGWDPCTPELKLEPSMLSPLIAGLKKLEDKC